MTPTPRAAYLLGAVALSSLVIPLGVAGLLALAVVSATAADAYAVRRRPAVKRSAPRVLARGVPAKLKLELDPATRGRVRLRQPVPPDLELTPSEADGALDAVVVARRRGRHRLPAPAVRVEGPLGLAAWYGRCAGEVETIVYPDLPAAFKLARSVRRSPTSDAGHRSRGPLGLGTEFESIRDYVPDDDIRQVNWLATARVGRPMSNQYRIEQERDIVSLVDSGRLMAAPLDERTRLDAALDAVAAVAMVADELGDRCGAVAFDSQVRRDVAPRRRGGRTVVRSLFDLEPAPVDSDYELAFHQVGASKRSFVLVFTDLLDEAAARALIDAVPVVARRHFVGVCSAVDTDLDAAVTSPPATPVDVYRAAVAVELLEARAVVVRRLRAVGAEVIEARPERLGAACVDAYLRGKARARL